MPVSVSESNVLTVALADPTDLEALDSIRYILKTDVEGVVTPKNHIDTAIAHYYNG